MPGGRDAPGAGHALKRRVSDLVESLGLEARTEVKVGRRLWGSERHIDVVATDPEARRSIGLECKYQKKPGTAEEKIPAIIDDIAAWPIPGLVVFDGEGFSANMMTYLDSTGKAVRLADLADWLRLFFGLPPGHVARGVRRTGDGAPARPAAPDDGPSLWDHPATRA